MVSGADSIPSRADTQPFDQADDTWEGWVWKMTIYLDLVGIQELMVLSVTFWPTEIGPKYSLSFLTIRLSATFSLTLLLFLKGLHFFGETAYVGFWEMLQGKVLSISPKYHQEIYLLFACFSHSLTSLLPNTFFFLFYFSFIHSREGLRIAFPQSHSAELS